MVLLYLLTVSIVTITLLYLLNRPMVSQTTIIVQPLGLVYSYLRSALISAVNCSIGNRYEHIIKVSTIISPLCLQGGCQPKQRNLHGQTTYK